MTDDLDSLTPTTPPAPEPRPPADLRERIAARIRLDAMVHAGVKLKALADDPWDTLSDTLRGPWLRNADSALAVVRDFGGDA